MRRPRERGSSSRRFRRATSRPANEACSDSLIKLLKVKQITIVLTPEAPLNDLCDYSIEKESQRTGASVADAVGLSSPNRLFSFLSLSLFSFACPFIQYYNWIFRVAVGVVLASLVVDWSWAKRKSKEERRKPSQIKRKETGELCDCFVRLFRGISSGRAFLDRDSFCAAVDREQIGFLARARRRNAAFVISEAATAAVGRHTESIRRIWQTGKKKYFRRCQCHLGRAKMFSLVVRSVFSRLPLACLVAASERSLGLLWPCTCIRGVASFSSRHATGWGKSSPIRYRRCGRFSEIRRPVSMQQRCLMTFSSSSAALFSSLVFLVGNLVGLTGPSRPSPRWYFYWLSISTDVFTREGIVLTLIGGGRSFWLGRDERTASRPKRTTAAAATLKGLSHLRWSVMINWPNSSVGSSSPSFHPSRRLLLSRRKRGRNEGKAGPSWRERVGHQPARKCWSVDEWRTARSPTAAPGRVNTTVNETAVMSNRPRRARHVTSAWPTRKINKTATTGPSTFPSLSLSLSLSDTTDSLDRAMFDRLLLDQNR